MSSTEPEKDELLWECVGYHEPNDHNALMTFRAAVPGGWLVAVRGLFRPSGKPSPRESSRPAEMHVPGAFRPPDFWGGLTFYPDPGHQWGDFVCPVEEPRIGFRTHEE